MAYYSGSLSEIQNVLKALGIGSGTIDDISPETVYASQADIDQRINGALSNMYDTPLVQITRDSVTKYPDPIPELARRLVASDLIINTLTDVDANVMATATVIASESKRDLFNLVTGLTGANQLAGQHRRVRNHFMPPGIAPAAESMPIT